MQGPPSPPPGYAPMPAVQSAKGPGVRFRAGPGQQGHATLGKHTWTESSPHLRTCISGGSQPELEHGAEVQLVAPPGITVPLRARSQ